MADSSESESLLTRIRRGARETLDRVSGAVQTRLPDLEAAAEEMLPKLATPENLERFQAVMSRLTRIVYGIGFSADPDAERLLELMDWVERRHGRRVVLEALQQHNPLFRQTFADVLQASRQSIVPGETAEDDLHERLEAYRESATIDVLRFMAQLASHESDNRPPGRAPDALASYVRRSNLPERFEPLIGRARGDAHAAEESRSSTEAADGTDLPARDGFGDRVRALVRRRVGVDRHLQFLSVGFLFASQGFLTRTALENLPEVLERANLESSDDIVDV